jgi:hypothetical protein
MVTANTFSLQYWTLIIPYLTKNEQHKKLGPAQAGYINNSKGTMKSKTSTENKSKQIKHINKL